ncbi:hypothetical protein Pint_16239 [Pistacia integerrima]|uniref:Uncharacterized protein n=1 Tax=Pistacia integerrima TaxID=434235 RepID=A0ACC0ZCK1_9ROSI|nr:hypothetical protein Pint_16239 [Pistacia integerrima]
MSCVSETARANKAGYVKLLLVNVSATGTTTGTPTTPVSSNTPTTTNPSTTNPTTTTTPYTTTPSNGMIGGVGSGSGLGPTGAGINTDYSHGGLRLANSAWLSFFVTLFVSGIILLWG